MSREQLEDALARLRAELDHLEQGSGTAHERLRAVIDEVEAELDALEGDAGASSLADSIRHHIEVFEVEHPRITSVLNDIMVTLSNLGI